MRHFDFTSSFDNLELPRDVIDILRATAHNKRLFKKTEIHDTDQYTTGSLRYESVDRPRPEFSSLDTFPDRLQTDRIEDIFKFFDFDRKASRFQLESWKAITSQLDHIKDPTTDTDRAAVVTAPTGFGKTPAFLGPAYHNAMFQDGERTIIVYPSRALLKDQLGRILETVHKVRGELFGHANRLSVGAWMGKQPYSKEELLNDGKSFVDPGSPGKLKVASHWSDTDTKFYIEDRPYPKTDPGYQVYDEQYRRTDGDEGVQFTDNHLVLHRDAIKEDDSEDARPDILLTTLESLEILAAKPYYDIALNAEYFIFDEIHQYQGLRGSHAAQVIRNIRQIRDKNAVYLGASATVDSPGSFAKSLFGFNRRSMEQYEQFEAGEDKIEVLQPFDEDVDESNTDALHYYFMLTGQNQEPGVASQYLQHSMMVGRSLLQNDPTGPDPALEADEEMSLLPLGDDPEAQRKLLAFIQSKSQIHRLQHQFENADKTRRLWQHHTLGQAGDWTRLADRTGHTFQGNTWDVDDPIAIYSDSEDDVDEIDDADIIHGTSFLEVGVDIDNLHFVSHYRPPENITTFKQRAGRAAREKDSSGHVFVHLSEFAGDSNFHYRADRFIQSSITTPIWAENEVISWMHDRFREFYLNLEEFRDASWYDGSWSANRNAERLITKYFTQELGWNVFTKFLTATGSQLDEIYDIRTAGGHLLQKGLDLETVREKIDDKIQSIRSEYEEIQSLLSEDTDELLLEEDAVSNFIIELSDAGLSLHEEFSEIVPAESFAEAKSTLERITTAEAPNQHIDEFLKALNAIKVGIEGERISIDPGLYPDERLERLDDAITVIREAADGGALDRKARQRQALYYLNQALDGIKEYRRAHVANHGQLLSIKGLFRAAYYYNRSLKRMRDSDAFQLHITPEEWAANESTDTDIKKEYRQIWYVPPNYFNDAGRYYTLEEPEFDANEAYEIEEKPVTSLLSQYIPYKIEHKPEIGDCQVFQPRVVFDEGDPKFDFSNIPGEDPTEDIRMPDRIRLDGVNDQSGELAQGVFEFDTDTYQIKPAAEGPTPVSDRGGHTTPVQLFAEAKIQSEVTTTGEAEFTSGNLQLSQAVAGVWLEGIDLKITHQKPTENGDDDGYKPLGNPQTKHIGATSPKLGYQLNTRTLTWDVSDLLAALSQADGRTENLSAPGRRVPGDQAVASTIYKSFDEITRQESLYTTAAHLLTLLVADVTGVDPNLLLYGYDTGAEEIYVFEQTEGGQGIVDLFCQHQEGRPNKVLDSLYRLMHNPQILSERLWAHAPAVDHIFGEVNIAAFSAEGAGRETAVDELEDIISDQLDLSYPNSVTRVAEEMASIIERVYSLTGDEVSIEAVFKLKHHLAAALVYERDSGDSVHTSEIPESVYDRFGATIETIGEESVRSLLLPKDVDSCKVNLQLDRTISTVPQDQALSYCMLEQVEEYLIDPVPKSENQEAMIEREAYWAWLDSSAQEVYFISW